MRIIFQALFPVLTISLVAGCASADRAADNDALARAKLETWPALYRARDAGGLNSFLADDFVLIGGPDKFQSKAAEVEWLRNNDWNGPEDFRYEIEDILYVSDDVAIVYGEGVSTREENGVACRHTYLSSNVFRRAGETWTPVSSHVSDAQCAPIEE